jgi:uncharacterized membrane protein YjjP (DUF1212 family)
VHALRFLVVLAGDYRFTATLVLVVVSASIFKIFGGDFDVVIAVLLLGCATAVYEHIQHQAQDKVTPE